MMMTKTQIMTIKTCQEGGVAFWRRDTRAECDFINAHLHIKIIIDRFKPWPFLLRSKMDLQKQMLNHSVLPAIS